MKWWDEPLRISAVQCNYGEDSFNILKEHTVGRKFNTEQLLHLTAEGHMAFYDEAKHGRKLDEYLVEAHENNIREIVYINVHCVLKKYRDENPGWIQLDRERKEITAYETQYLTCVNNEWFDFYEKNLRLLCKHDIDGIFLDGPVFSTQGCYCKACEAKFKSRYGKSIDSATGNEMLEFKVDSVTEFIRKTNEIVKSINPNILLYLNNSALRADVTGSNTRKVEPYVDMLGAEGGFVWVDHNTSLWHAGSMAKYIETQAKGKPTVIFIAGDHKPYSYYMHTAAETKILFAQSVANGANVWYGIHAPTYIMDSPGGRAAEQFNSFLAENEEYYRQTKPVAKIALMWSMDSANYYSSSVATTDFTQAQHIGGTSRKGNHYNAFSGFFAVLERTHAQFDIIDEQNILDGTVGKYDLLILPTCGCIGKAVADGIRKYVADGGKLISTYDTGFYGEKGQAYDKPVLADVMGIEEVYGSVEYRLAGTGYQRILDQELMKWGVSAPMIPTPDLAMKFKPSSSAKVISMYLEPMQGRYEALPKDEYPGMVFNAYGKGGSLYIAGTAGEFYHAKTNTDYRKLISYFIAGMSDTVVKSDAPGSVELVLRSQEQNGRYLLHAINMTAEMGRPMERIIPVYDVRVELNLGREVKSVRHIDGSGVSFKCNGGSVVINIPKLNEYDIFVIEY